MQRALLFLLFSLTLSCNHRKATAIQLQTAMGDLHLDLYGDTPQHQRQFFALAGAQGSDTMLFTQVLRDYLIVFEAPAQHADQRKHLLPEHHTPLCRGVIAAFDTLKNHGPGDFFIVLGRPQTEESLNRIEKQEGLQFSEKDRAAYKKWGGIPQWQGKCSVFGKVTAGMEVADRIAAVPRDAANRPLSPIWLCYKMK